MDAPIVRWDFIIVNCETCCGKKSKDINFQKKENRFNNAKKKLWQTYEKVQNVKYDQRERKIRDSEENKIA